MWKNEVELTEQYYGELSEKDPKTIENFINIGKTYMAMKNHKKGIKIL